VKPVPRRRVLQTSGVALSVIGSGCTGIQNGESQNTEIDRIEVVNKVPNQQAIQILLVEDGDPKYWKSANVGPYSEDENELGTVVITDLPSEQGEYTLYTWLDDQSRSEWSHYDFSEDDLECADILVMIEEGSNTSIHISNCSDD